MRINVGVIFGGKSVEHEISIISAVEAMGYLDENKYQVIPIYIDKDNNWWTGMHLKDIVNYRDIALVKRYAKKVALVKNDNRIILQSLSFLKKNLYVIDLVMPIGHGPYMEDGSIQGYLNMLDIPYIGPEVLPAAIGQDKVVMKQLLEFNNIPVTNYTWFTDKEFASNKKECLEKISTLKYPLYVKPASLGSSIGITKVENETNLISAIKNVFKYVLFIFMAIFLLNLYGVNTTSVIAGLGVAGVVLGFALQEALKDIISGISIIFDDFFVVGDIVDYNGFAGTIIEFGLKTTKIKKVTGEVMVVANRNIDKIINISKERATLLLNIPTAYEEKYDKIEKVLNETLETALNKYKSITGDLGNSKMQIKT